MKAAVVQVTAPAAPGNMDFTDASVTSDLKCALFATSVATANDTSTARGRCGFGFTDLTNNFGVAMDESDATAGAGAQGVVSTTKSILAYTANSGVAGPTGGYSSTLSNGVRMNITTTTSGRLVSALLISGSDTAAKVGNVQFAAADTSKVVAHGLGGTPDLIIVMMASGGNGDITAISGVGTGFWDNTGGMAGSTIVLTNNANPTQDNALINSGESGRVISTAGASVATVTIGSVGATNFTITFSAATGTNVLTGWFAIRGTSQALAAKAFMANTPTSTGNTVLVSGMSSAPSVLITLPTRLTTSGSVLTDDSAGAYGWGFAANNSGTSQYGCAIAQAKDNVATSVAKNFASNTGIGALDNTGAYTLKFTVNSWDSGGATANYSVVNASALKLAGIAFGMPNTFVFIPRRTIRSISPVYIPQSF